MSTNAPQPVLNGEKKTVVGGAEQHLFQVAALLISLVSCLLTGSFLSQFFVRDNPLAVFLSGTGSGFVRFLCVMVGLVLGIRVKHTKAGKVTVTLSAVTGILDLAASIYIAWVMSHFDF